MAESVVTFAIGISLIFVNLLSMAECNDEEVLSNEIKEEPFVLCAPDAIYFKVRTKEKFEGRVYLKGQRETETNITCYQLLVTKNQVEVLIPHLDCNLQRLRSAEPRGLKVRTSIVVSFHQEFLTENDKIYKLNCFYVSKKPTDNISDWKPLVARTGSSSKTPRLRPSCHYVVSKSKELIEPVKYASIGDTVYHRWQCLNAKSHDKSSEISLMNQFCILISDCFVSGNDNVKRWLTDENGCSLDANILGRISYSDSNATAQVQSKLFGLHGQSALYFQCQITLIPRKSGSACERTNCSSNATALLSRQNRDVATLLKANEAAVMDAASQEINMLAGGENLKGDSGICSKDAESYESVVSLRVNTGDTICLSRTTLALISSSLMLIMVATLLLVIAVVCRRSLLFPHNPLDIYQ